MATTSIQKSWFRRDRWNSQFNYSISLQKNNTHDKNCNFQEPPFNHQKQNESSQLQKIKRGFPKKSLSINFISFEMKDFSSLKNFSGSSKKNWSKDLNSVKVWIGNNLEWRRRERKGYFFLSKVWNTLWILND